jgi:hypothetical protein
VNDRPVGGADAAAAGGLLIAAIVVGVLAGLGVGTLLAAPVPLAILGGAIGLGAGFRLVLGRFRDI